MLNDANYFARKGFVLEKPRLLSKMLKFQITLSLPNFIQGTLVLAYRPSKLKNYGRIFKSTAFNSEI